VHLDACVVAEVAHVAVASEGEVVVAAALAYPVTGALMGGLLLFLCREGHWCEPASQWLPCSLGCLESSLLPFTPVCGWSQIGIHFKILKFAALLHLDSLQFQAGGSILRLGLQQVKRLASQILLGSHFLASVAFLSALEIVVLAL
jgi:hypothetical protein